jgi:hypothetical protein
VRKWVRRVGRRVWSTLNQWAVRRVRIMPLFGMPW